MKFRNAWPASAPTYRDASTPIGLSGLGAVVQVIRARDPKFPICGISGINQGNAADVIAQGADGVAVISALSLAGDPTAAARDLLSSVDEALAKRSKS